MYHPALTKALKEHMFCITPHVFIHLTQKLLNKQLSMLRKCRGFAQPYLPTVSLQMMLVLVRLDDCSQGYLILYQQHMHHCGVEHL